MKKFVLMMTVITLLLSACGKDDDNTNPTSGSYVKMKINGRSWEASSNAVAGLSVIDGVTNATIIGKANFEGQESVISIIFSTAEGITEDTYDLSDSDDAAASVTKIDGKTYMMMSFSPTTSCVVNITGIQTVGGIKKIKGTFSGKFLGPAPGDYITITDGEFSGY